MSDTTDLIGSRIILPLEGNLPDQLVSQSDVMKAFWKQSDLMKDSAKAFWKYLATQMVHLLKKMVPMKPKEASIQLAENLVHQTEPN